MANLTRLAGVTTVEIGGVIFNNTEVSWTPLQTVKEAIIGLNGVAGYKETYVTTKMVVTIYDYGQLTVQDFASGSTTLQVILANGKVIIMNNAFLSGDITVNAAEATMQLTFEGTGITEQTT